MTAKIFQENFNICLSFLHDFNALINNDEILWATRFIRIRNEEIKFQVKHRQRLEFYLIWKAGR
jgi:hypothetical protein